MLKRDAYEADAPYMFDCENNCENSYADARCV